MSEAAEATLPRLVKNECGDWEVKEEDGRRYALCTVKSQLGRAIENTIGEAVSKATEGFVSAELAATDEPDWKAIAIALNHRVQMAVKSFKVPGSGLILNTETNTMQHWLDYFADGLEMIPGLKVDREMMHARTSAERKRILRRREAK